jgi:signal transduction histidine kinase
VKIYRCRVLIDARERPITNPGSNPVTIPTEGVEARYLRISGLPQTPGAQPRFGLSEVEIYSNEENVARKAVVARQLDPWPTSVNWPPQLLVDGFTSYGRLIELPEWLAGWNLRRELRAELAALDAAQPELLLEAQRRARELAIVAAGGLALFIAWLIWRSRRRRAREMEALRLRLARDLHDEIGSNLAAIAVVSEMAVNEAPPGAAADEWQEVHSIAREAMDAMREVLWVIGAREEAGFDLLARMRRVASRMFTGRQIVWREFPETIPDEVPVPVRRQLFLFYKETVSNAARHARATELQVTLRFAPREVRLEIADNGCGFDPSAAPSGVGISSLHERARRLRGQVRITSAPGAGTTVALHGRW